jgi:hypothetical protein
VSGMERGLGCERDGRPEVSRRRRAEERSHMWLCAQAAEFYDIGIENLVPRLNKCLDKGGDYVKKWLKVCVKSFFRSILLITIFKKILLRLYLYFLDVLRNCATDALTM